MSEKKSTVGDPIWVESILSDSDYLAMSKVYPNTYTNGGKKIPMFECEVKWRYGMGAKLTPQEVKLRNDKMDAVMIKAGLIKKSV